MRGSSFQSTSLYRVWLHGTIMAPYLRSLFLIPSTLDAYCMCTCDNDTVGLEGLSANYIPLMACATGGGAAFGLEYSFVWSVITHQQLQVYSIFRNLHHIQCARSVLMTVVLRFRQAHSACEITASARNERIIRFFLGLEDPCYGSGFVEQNPSPIAKWRVPN